MRDKRLFIIVVVIAIALKLWLTSEIRTAAEFAPHDASNFLVHGRSLAMGHWFGAYDDLTLIKQPFYPIFLAIVEQSGLPLTVMVILLDALAACVACWAIMPIVRSTAAQSVTFIVLFFNPFSFDTLSWTSDRSQINPALALLVVSTAFAVYVRRRGRIRRSYTWMAAFGVSLTAFWLNREEAPWIIPCITIIIGAYYWWVFCNAKQQLSRRLVALLLPLVCVCGGVETIKQINLRVYGWAVTNEQQAPEFISAYNSLVRIDVPKKRYLPLPRSARLLAYAVSPAAAELRAGFEGWDGKAWQANTCSAMAQLCNTHEIGGGWTEWALRDAVAIAGHYDSGAHARAFYLKLAQQLDAACDAKRLPCLRKSFSVFPPPIRSHDIPDILRDFIRGYGILLSYSTWVFGPPPVAPVPQALKYDYDFVARSVYEPENFHRFVGWLAYDHKTPPKIIGPDSTAVELTFSSSPDVAKALATTPGISKAGAGYARFELGTSCDEQCAIVVQRANGTTVTIPLADKVTDFRAPGVVYHLDGSRKVDEFARYFKRDVLVEIGRTYQALSALVVAGGVLVALLRLIRRIGGHRFARNADFVLFDIAVFTSVSLLLLLLAVMDTLAFGNAFYAGYMGAINPLLLLGVCMTLATAINTVERYLRRKLPRPQPVRVTA